MASMNQRSETSMKSWAHMIQLQPDGIVLCADAFQCYVAPALVYRCSPFHRARLRRDAPVQSAKALAAWPRDLLTLFAHSHHYDCAEWLHLHLALCRDYALHQGA